MLRLAPVLLVSLVLAVPARAQTADPSGTIEPGTYELEITFGGGVLEGSLEIQQRADSLAVVLMVGEHQSPVRPSRREGNLLELASSDPGTDIHYRLIFRGPAVTGSFTYNGDPGSVTGRKRPAR